MYKRQIQFYAARRKLTGEFPDGKVDMKKLSDEYDELEQAHNTTYGDVYKRQLPKGSSRNREAEAKSWKQRPAGELGLCSMVNVSKSLLNVVSGNRCV